MLILRHAFRTDGIRTPSRMVPFRILPIQSRLRESHSTALPTYHLAPPSSKINVNQAQHGVVVVFARSSGQPSKMSLQVQPTGGALWRRFRQCAFAITRDGALLGGVRLVRPRGGCVDLSRRRDDPKREVSLRSAGPTPQRD
ncbi:hypothetical protein Zmor_000692 [Zophobas morio]|uniref:Uncharacterized protein n=1 Tax=Zophobas morio TaxID=2755281 RepID=A0AA38MRN0_9CUCU|nr:hypothetical protein Zmor_009153 [Zophobas morio]KAJ3665184.1 hypothetical protein Zmor_000692 [Zophobas morio]